VRLKLEGVISHFETCEGASPIVAIPKKNNNNNKIQIRVDLKSTLNPYIKADEHEEFFLFLIDLSEAYLKLKEHLQGVIF